jgi:hypothetical protein
MNTGDNGPEVQKVLERMRHIKIEHCLDTVLQNINETLAYGEHRSRPISLIGSMAALFQPPSHLR